MRSHLIVLLLCAFILPAQASPADAYPQRPVRLIVPYPPGGAGDIVGRMLAAKLTEGLRQQVVVDNRGGGGQLIATELAAKAPPDGHTLFLASATHGINPGLRKKLPYDSIKDFSPLPALPHVKSGRLRGLAMTGRSRSRAAPEIPTVAESGVPGYESSLWYALLAPARTPQPIIARLHSETARILRLPDVTEQLLSQGAEPIGSNPQELAKFLAAEINRWTQVIEQAKIRAE